ncbi:MAG TPA: hypothetical protein ENN97_07715 [Phycisphaerales bacterium]|nr:hypothetical protein [Phycisphaerales bacterium]
MNIDVFNLVEGMFWIGLGVWLLVTRRVVRRGRHLVLGVPGNVWHFGFRRDVQRGVVAAVVAADMEKCLHWRTDVFFHSLCF